MPSRRRPKSIVQVHFSFALALAGLPACAAPGPDPSVARAAPEVLPLRSLRLYETGVGYFERSGTIGARGATSLPVPPGHLDDALASLVVLRGGGGAGAGPSAGEGFVTGLSFESSVTKATARSRAGLPADPASPIAFKDLLDSMKGEKVAVVLKEAREPADGARPVEPLVGRVVEVAMEVDEEQARALAEHKDAHPSEPPTRLVVTLLTEANAIARVPASDIVRVRPVDPAFAGRLDEALDALGTRSTRNARALRLLGDAKGQVAFGYVAETPIWRASYRLIEATHTGATAATTSAVLQGWALLHNDTDESWHDVHLELVNGEPDSFLFPMAAPRYARRELVHPDNPLSTLPQLQDTTADTLWGDHLDEGVSSVGQGFGTGSGHGRLGGSHQVKAPVLRLGEQSVDGSVGASALLDVGNLADLAPATGVEQGALFVYAVPAGFSLEAHSSALVPFVERGVAAESVTYFPGPGAAGRSAIHFVNSTGQTLPTGTITVFGAGGFTGETSLARLKPGERRFLQIGNDLDGEVTRTKVQRHEEPRRLTFEGDSLREHFLKTTTETWELENRAATPRTFYVVLDAEKNAKVTGTDRVDFDEASSKPVVVFTVKPKEKGARTFTVTEGLSRVLSLDGLTEKSARALLQKTTIAAAELATLQQALPRVQALEAGRTAVAAEAHASQVAEEALGRLREDLKALGGGATAGGGAAAAPIVSRVVVAEDRVEAARKTKEAAEKTLGERREALREALRKLTLLAPGS